MEDLNTTVFKATKLIESLVNCRVFDLSILFLDLFELGKVSLEFLSHYSSSGLRYSTGHFSRSNR